MALISCPECGKQISDKSFDFSSVQPGKLWKVVVTM